MSYNGVGLFTPRGSGTNGYVQRNFALVRQKRVYQTPEELANMKGPPPRKANKEILDHERKRKVELRVLMLQEQMKTEGYDEAKIAERVATARKAWEREIQVEDADAPLSESHAISAAKEKEMDRLSTAFGIDSRVWAEGQSFKVLEENMKRKKEIEGKGADGSSAPLAAVVGSGGAGARTGDKPKAKRPELKEPWLQAVPQVPAADEGEDDSDLDDDERARRHRAREAESRRTNHNTKLRLSRSDIDDRFKSVKGRGFDERRRSRSRDRARRSRDRSREKERDRRSRERERDRVRDRDRDRDRGRDRSPRRRSSTERDAERYRPSSRSREREREREKDKEKEAEKSKGDEKDKAKEKEQGERSRSRERSSERRSRSPDGKDGKDGEVKDKDKSEGDTKEKAKAKDGDASGDDSGSESD